MFFKFVFIVIYFQIEQILKKLLPPHNETPSSFETIGHIAHINLRDEFLPYKRIIGEVLLEVQISLVNFNEQISNAKYYSIIYLVLILYLEKSKTKNSSEQSRKN
jgi:hypothetical protein